MAIEDWLRDEYDVDDFEWEEIPFKTECRFCGKRITMTPTDDGWKPMFRRKLHICDERIASQRKDMIGMLPRLP